MMRFDTELPTDMTEAIEKWRGYSKNHDAYKDEEED
jgi:23S rRNA pseudouridine1911/1915/1917 synthase